MGKIQVLDKLTIDKIAAGEVVEKPLSVVKELVENAMDAGAKSITVEIKEGGISYIRITDNGSGIAKDDLEMAFLRHSTSKISSSNDLSHIHTLGFRGEALSSISAVSQMEVITKTTADMMGSRLIIEGGCIKERSEIGAPDGTTMIVRNLFYNTPARRKFLKTAQTEGAYISAVMEHLALSHPDISFRFIANGQTKLQTAGNGSLMDVIYRIWGREVVNDLIPISLSASNMELEGFVAKPSLSRGNRNYENFFVNGRYVKCSILYKAVEEGYKSFIMQHKFPFVVLNLSVKEDEVDVNVHPAKMEIRFSDESNIYDFLVNSIRTTLSKKELISSSNRMDEIEAEKNRRELLKQTLKPEPFETSKLQQLRAYVRESSPYEPKFERTVQPILPNQGMEKEKNIHTEPIVQTSLLDEKKPLLDVKSKANHKIIGQIFETYWLVEFQNSLYIIDQHAAHERVLYEKIMKSLAQKETLSQQISPPIVVSLSDTEQCLLEKYKDEFYRLGFSFESFGGKDVMISEVPYNMFNINDKELFVGMIDELNDFSGRETPEIVLEKIAMMSCKAAVKGNQKLSFEEAKGLMEQLLELENPYHCPHGRPTIIEIKKGEMERRFHR